MDDLLFYLALGGAILITVICGIRIMRKYPRIRQSPDPPPALTKLPEILELERERLRRQEVCSDKTHWK